MEKLTIYLSQFSSLQVYFCITSSKKYCNHEGSFPQVFVLDTAGGNECVAVEPERPSYKRLQEILKSRIGSRAGQGWFDRLLGEFKFNQESLKNDDN